MTETNQTRGDSDRLTPPRWHGAALSVATGVALLLVVVFEISAWRQLRNLQAAFDTFRPEIFYLGNELQAGITRMNGALLRFQLSSENDEREAFQKKAEELRASMAKTLPALRTPAERRFAEEAQMLFEKYLGDLAPLRERGVVGVRRDSVTRIQTQIDEASIELREAARKLAEAQRISLDAYVESSLKSTFVVRRSMEISAALLVLLIASIAALIYWTKVRPLRARLSESEAAMARQERLASLGTLATGIAHEIRNPLTAIKFRLFSLKKTPPLTRMQNEDVDVIGEEINRLERLVTEFLQFARPSKPVMTAVGTTDLLKAVEDLLKPQAERQDIELKVEEANGLWLKGDKQQLEQVLINLVQNAADSIGSNGAITLRGRAGVSRIDGRAGPVVILEVTDTGAGIPPEAEARIFDPFFSTKDSGTGLGLSIAARIVEMHGGFIQYQTHRNRGTTFSVVLPRPPTDDSANPSH